MLIASNVKNFKHQWIWNKSSAGNILVAKYQPLKIEEEILVFSKNSKKVNYYPIFIDGEKDRTKEKPTKKESDLFEDIKRRDFTLSISILTSINNNKFHIILYNYYNVN